MQCFTLRADVHPWEDIYVVHTGGSEVWKTLEVSPRYCAATRKPVFVQILGRGVLVIIHYGDWFCGGKKNLLKTT